MGRLERSGIRPERSHGFTAKRATPRTQGDEHDGRDPRQGEPHGNDVVPDAAKRSRSCRPAYASRILRFTLYPRSPNGSSRSSQISSSSVSSSSSEKSGESLTSTS